MRYARDDVTTVGSGIQPSVPRLKQLEVPPARQYENQSSILH